MNLIEQGARAARQRMKALGNLPLASKLWEPGDRVLFVFPVNSVTPEGYPDFPVGEKYGHSISLPKDSNFGQSFVTTTITEFDERGKPVGGDFLTKLASLSFALRKGYKERKIEQETRDSPNEEALKSALATLEKTMKNYNQIVGRLQLKIAMECFVGKLDVNGHMKDGKVELQHAIMGISPTKFDALLALSEKQGAYIPGTNYFYVEMETTASLDKPQAGQADWRTPAIRLESVHENFQSTVTKMVQDAHITREVIESHFWDFRPYDVNQLKSELANAINKELYTLKKLDNKTYHDFAQENYIAEALEEVQLMADANFIRQLVEQSTPTADQVMSGLNADMAQAQTIAPQAQTITPQAQTVTPQAQTVTPQAQTVTPAEQQTVPSAEQPQQAPNDPFATGAPVN